MGFDAEHASYEIFIEARAEFNGVGIYFYPPTKIPSKNLIKVMEFITRINYGLRLGHFELDMDDGILRFAHHLELEGSQLTPPMLLNVLYFGLTLIDDYYPGLMRIIFSGVSPAQALAEIRSGQAVSYESAIPGFSKRPMDKIRH